MKANRSALTHTLLLTGFCLLPSTLLFGQSPAARQITVNGRSLDSGQQARLEALERSYGVRLPDANFWYDNRSGAFGFWNGPAISVLPPRLDLGGPMPSNCSGGGTRVFVNEIGRASCRERV